MTTIRQHDFIQSVADALQFISYYHPRTTSARWARPTSGRVAGGEGRDRADPHQLAHVRRRPSPDLPGHRHRRRVRQGRHGRALGRRRRCRSPTWSTKACAAPICDPDNKLRASILADPAGARKNTQDNTPAVVHFDLVPGDTVDVKIAAKGGGSENKSKFAMLNPSDSIVDWVLKTVPTMGAGWCPPGMLGIGIGGTRREGDAAGEGSADGADRHARARKRAARRTGSRSCASSSTTRSTRSASARRAWAGCRRCSTSRSSTIPTHAASLPVAMIPNCAATRHAHFMLDGSRPGEARAARPLAAGRTCTGRRRRLRGASTSTR